MTQQNSDNALRDSEARLRAILDTAVDGILTIDERGTVQAMNPAAERMFGWPSDEVVGRNVNMLMPSPYREEHDQYVSNYLQTGIAKIIGIGREVSGRRADGSEFPMYLAVSEVRTDHGRLFTGIVRDITVQRAAEQAVLTERDFADSVIDTAQVIVLVLDCDARIVRFNRYLKELTGYTLADAKGQDWFDVFLPADERGRVRDEFRRMSGGAPSPGFTNSIQARDGRLYEFAWWAKPLEDADGRTTGILAVGHDMTLLKEAQAQLVQSERLAAIGQMMAGLAHESRNALQRSQACLEMLEMEIEDNPAAMDQVRRIQRAQDDLNRLFDEVRDYAAPIKLDRSDSTLPAVWREAWSLLEKERDGRYAELREVSNGVDPRLSVDHFRLVQAFRNLMENSLAARQGDVRISIECREILDHGRRAIQVTYRDNGPGLNEEQRSRIFDPFYTTKTKGTGLGMPIARRILEAHGGWLDVDASLDADGAVFRLILPREETP